MSWKTSGTSSDGLFTASNLASPVLQTLCGWLKFTTLNAGTLRSLIAMNDSGPVHTNTLNILTNDDIQLAQLTGSNTQGPPNPTFTNWNFYAWTTGPAGAGSFIGYFCDNASSSLTTMTPLTGVASWTPTAMAIGIVGGNGPAIVEGYNWLEWDSVLTPTQLLAQKNQLAPVTLTSIRRIMVGTNGATAGTDTSGHGFSMTNSGTLVDGTDNPTFPGTGGVLAAAEYYYGMLQ